MVVGNEKVVSDKPPDRNASKVFFGLDFQRNAAIVLMLDNIKDLYSLRLEGNFEDIELTLDNGKKILAQAKGIEKGSTDFRHVRENLKKAIESLYDGAKKVDVQQLVFVTNSLNPFKDEESRGIFSGCDNRRKYSDLPESAQAIINDILERVGVQLDLSKFTVRTFQFETDIDDERYKVVMQKVNDFIGEIKHSVSAGLGKQLLKVWLECIFGNGSKSNRSIELNKKDIVWPILVIETDIRRGDVNRVIDMIGIDDGLYDEVVYHYGDVINSCCEKIEFFTQILSDYRSFKNAHSGELKEFIDESWRNYEDCFKVEGIDGDISEALVKVIVYNVVRRRYTIDSVRGVTNL